jgi:hypothetical protein
MPSSAASKPPVFRSNVSIDDLANAINVRFLAIWQDLFYVKYFVAVNDALSCVYGPVAQSDSAFAYAGISASFKRTKAR